MNGLVVRFGKPLMLAREESKRSRNSYLWTGAIALTAGILAAFLAGRTFSAEGPSAGSPLAFLLDIVFFLGFSVLARSGAWTSRGKTSFASDEHLAFLRRLPLTVRDLVVGRMLTVAFSVVVVSVPILSLPYVFSASFRAQLGATEYLLFTAFWVGYVLALEGIGLFTELGLGGWTGFLIYTALITVLGGFVGYANGEEISVVGEVIGLVQRNGPLLGLPVLLFGILTFALSGWVTARRLEKRELAP